MTILVAGGTGFLGSAIVRELCRRGREVAVMSRNAERVRERFAGLAVDPREGDARDENSLREAVQGVHALISTMQFPNFPIEDKAAGNTFDEVDARGNERLVAAAKAAGVPAYVYVSGTGAAPEGHYHWHRAKWRAEEAVRGSGLRYTIVRPSWVYGPEDRSLNRFAGFARKLPFVPVVGSGAQRLQPVFVDDVARVVADSLDSEAASNQTLEIGGPDVLTMDEVLRTMLAVMGVRRPLIHAPEFGPRTLAAIMELLPAGRRPLSRDAISFITMDAVADNGPLLTAFPGLRLTPLREGLERYLTPEPA